MPTIQERLATIETEVKAGNAKTDHLIALIQGTPDNPHAGLAPRLTRVETTIRTARRAFWSLMPPAVIALVGFIWHFIVTGEIKVK